MLNIALPKGRLGEKVYAMFERAGFECPAIHEENRKLFFENEALGLRYFWVKPSDVAIYVERGAADIGVVGKDILLEYEPEVYELLDLNCGKCRMCVAAPAAFRDDPRRTLPHRLRLLRLPGPGYRHHPPQRFHRAGAHSGAVGRDRGYCGDRHHLKGKQSRGDGDRGPHLHAADRQQGEL